MDVKAYMYDLGRAARAASFALAKADTNTKNRALHAMADALVRDTDVLVAANEADLAAAREAGLAPAMLDRLTLDAKGVAQMAEGLRQIAALPDPVGEMSDFAYRPSGIQLGKMRVPLGVVGIIYEARPNVTADAIGLCLKSGNAVILKGGSEAIRSNKAIAGVLTEAAENAGIPKDALQFIDSVDRAAVQELIRMDRYVDVVIPRGGAGLINMVVQNSSVPVIQTGVGVCQFAL